MVTLKPSEVFSPEIVGEVAVDITMEKTDLLTTGFVGDARETAVVDGYNDTIQFPYVEEVATNAFVQTDPESGASVDGDNLNIKYDSASVSPKIIAFTMKQSDLRKMQQTLDPSAFMAGLVQQKARAHIQTILLATGASTALAKASVYSEPTGQASWDGLMKASVTNWGEKAWDGAHLLVAHSSVVYDLVTSDEAKKKGFYDPSVPGTISSGRLLNFAGKFILPLDSVAKVGGAGADKDFYKNLILQPGALLVYMRDEMEYHEQILRNSTIWDIWWSFSFASYLRRAKPLEAILYKAAAIGLGA